MKKCNDKSRTGKLNVNVVSVRYRKATNNKNISQRRYKPWLHPYLKSPDNFVANSISRMYYHR